MNIRSIHAINCYNGKAKTYIHMLKGILFFEAETCARRVIIFCNLSNDELLKVKAFAKKLKNTAEVCELHSGYEAYYFLLQWSVGLLNPKYNFNDRFVLGRLKSNWTEFSKEEAQRLKGTHFLKILPAILADAHQIRQKIEMEFLKNQLVKASLPKEERIIKTQQLCKELSLQRLEACPTHELKLHKKVEVDLKNRSLETVLIDLSKTIKHLQSDISSFSGVVKFKSNPTEQSLLIKTKLGITAAWERMRLMYKDDTDNVIEPDKRNDLVYR